MKKFLIILPLIFAVGCIGSNVNVDANNGLIVNEFSADPLQAEADDAVRFFLDAENVGGTTARCVTTELFGVDAWRDEFGAPLSTLTGPVGYVTKGFSFLFSKNDDGWGLNACYTDIRRAQVCAGYSKYNDDTSVSLSGFLGSAFTDFGGRFCSSLETFDPSFRLLRFQPELVAPVPSSGRAGQSFTSEWILRPPVLPEGLAVDYPITARTSYFYFTNAVMNVQSLNKAEFRRRADLGQPVEFPLSVENSFGSPIQIFVTRGSSPIVVNPESFSGPYQYESYRFEFANLGDGFPLPLATDLPGIVSPQTQSGFIFAALAVNGPGVFFSDCLGQSGTEVLISGDMISDLVKLRGDQRVPIGCTVAIDRNAWVDKPIGTVSFTFSLWYRYFIDKQIDVRVLGIEGISGILQV